MLSPALINAADRLSTTLMTIVYAISPILLTGTATFPDHAVQTLFFRLAHLVRTLIRISNFGIRAPARRPTTPARLPPGPITQSPPRGPAQTLPRRPGWLLAALPDIAPAVAADLAALLADPALTNLFAAIPTLHRILRPILRGLDLAAPQPPPSPRTPPPPSGGRPEPRPVPQPAPATPSPRPAAVPSCHAEIKPSHPAPSYVQIVTVA